MKKRELISNVRRIFSYICLAYFLSLVIIGLAVGLIGWILYIFGLDTKVVGSIYIIIEKILGISVFIIGMPFIFNIFYNSKKYGKFEITPKFRKPTVYDGTIDFFEIKELQFNKMLKGTYENKVFSCDYYIERIPRKRNILTKNCRERAYKNKIFIYAFVKTEVTTEYIKMRSRNFKEFYDYLLKNELNSKTEYRTLSIFMISTCNNIGKLEEHLITRNYYIFNDYAIIPILVSKYENKTFVTRFNNGSEGDIDCMFGKKRINKIMKKYLKKIKYKKYYK
jgi:hypothetical protein